METHSTPKKGDALLPRVRRRLVAPALSMGAAAMLAQTACYFACDIFINSGDRKANAKSMMSILSLGASEGAPLTLVARGQDARDAVDAITETLSIESEMSFRVPPIDGGLRP